MYMMLMILDVGQIFMQYDKIRNETDLVINVMTNKSDSDQISPQDGSNVLWNEDDHIYRLLHAG